MTEHEFYKWSTRSCSHVLYPSRWPALIATAWSVASEIGMWNSGSRSLDAPESTKSTALFQLLDRTADQQTRADETRKDQIRLNWSARGSPTPETLADRSLFKKSGVTLDGRLVQFPILQHVHFLGRP
ncbi:hypothetical protein E4U43_004883 [Claviceps pusilla]|uniref:Uncharacterized protein n=1 Tax=Claviceps pusilla TaxID=123648 RepID=A0A9P7T2U7_9HYPO|nr:hypothetical protein E4U43_004883 [Claviceps pusilla]